MTRRGAVSWMNETQVALSASARHAWFAQWTLHCEGRIVAILKAEEAISEDVAIRAATAAGVEGHSDPRTVLPPFRAIASELSAQGWHLAWHTAAGMQSVAPRPAALAILAQHAPDNREERTRQALATLDGVGKERYAAVAALLPELPPNEQATLLGRASKFFTWKGVDWRLLQAVGKVDPSVGAPLLDAAARMDGPVGHRRALPGDRRGARDETPCLHR